MNLLPEKRVAMQTRFGKRSFFSSATYFFSGEDFLVPYMYGLALYMHSANGDAPVII